AAADLDEIWSYIAQDNPDAADKLMAAFASRFLRLASMPELGRSRAELSLGLRGFPVGRYVIFYRQRECHIEIIRVLHGARDFPPLFE
ncbi:MAG TPA: type II toxin-antitoxin system RelE/ParE family toxin, partial [Verrucomicrobiae bacterium]|nr:type II toxin-antitoxin system RelE/ParE family toxin [Verrucomicrobiae bacterium]